MKKLIIAMVLLLLPMHALAFTDVDNLDNSLREPVYALIAEGAIQGYSDGTFRPQNTITVGEYAKILIVPILNTYIIPTLSREEKENVSDSVIAGDIEDILGYAKEYGIIDIDTDLHAYITREQAVLFIVGAYKLNVDDIDTSDLPFTDIGAQSTQEAVQRLYDDEIIQGRSTTLFAPVDHLTRAESAKVLYLSKKAYLNDLDETDFGWQISGTILEITDISPDSLMAGETASIIFTVKDAYTGKVIDSVDVTDLNVQVIKGNATVTDVSEIGPGVFLASIKVDDFASEGHLNVQISLVYGRVYVTTTDEYLEQNSEQDSSDLKVFPNPVRRNNEATVIAIPRDHHGEPVSGLTLDAYISGGSGQITTTMVEDPAGSGIYISTYNAGNIADEFDICVRILDYSPANEYCVPVEVK